MKIGKETLKDIQRTKEKDYKLTSTHSSKERRKILSRDKCFRTCYKRGSIPRTRRKMEIHCIFVKDNAICRKKLQDL